MFVLVSAGQQRRQIAVPMTRSDARTTVVIVEAIGHDPHEICSPHLFERGLTPTAASITNQTDFLTATLFEE
jgi:hypothetical protein